MYPTFSVVINTLNRASELQKTLESFKWLKYPGEFEIIVVNGPSSDHTEDIIASWLPLIRVGKCEVANLSVSRNIGICMAQGDIVAFIDDDAIPEPEWLTQLSEVYKDPIVGGAGGLVYNHTGYEFQSKYCVVDRFGNADTSQIQPTPHLSFPKSYRFPHLLGCNASFRRAALLEINGFDEEFEYFLDETDVCLRIVDEGYLIAQLPCAYVHHKYAPSNIRGHNKVVRYRYPIIKNKIYFMLKHAREIYPLDRIMQEQQNFIQTQRNEVSWATSQKLISDVDVRSFHKDIERAIEVGIKRGIEGVADGSMIDNKKLQKYAGHFFAFNTLKNDTYRVIVLISRDFPPNHGGGIATFNKDLSEALAAEGNIVHVITQSKDINSVDFENGVWVHRRVIHKLDRSPVAIKRKIPQQIWNWSATALEETKRIATHRTINVVEAPIWDCEGAAFLLNGQWPLVTSLQTTLQFWLESHPELKADMGWMDTFGSPMLELEQSLMVQSNAIRSISSAIRHEIELAYGFRFDDKKICIAPLGMINQELEIKELIPAETVTVLFVGRLEYRKGIDILLAAIPQVLEINPNVRFRIIGDDTLLKPGENKTYKDEYLSSSMGRRWNKEVKFEGRIDNDVLRIAYKTCDLFVAPSRFESFGLVFLEAMREGKPVIGCLAGGMPEVVSKDVNGLLIEPGSVDALVTAILRLVTSEELRLSMGAAGRELFLEKFTSEIMAKVSGQVYDLAKENFNVAWA